MPTDKRKEVPTEKEHYEKFEINSNRIHLIKVSKILALQAPNASMTSVQEILSSGFQIHISPQEPKRPQITNNYGCGQLLQSCAGRVDPLQNRHFGMISVPDPFFKEVYR